MKGGLGISKLIWDSYGDRLHEAACSLLPAFRDHEKWYGAVSVAGGLLATKFSFDRHRERALKRARSLQSHVRVVKPKAPILVARLLEQLFQSTDTIDAIRNVYIGVSAHQKLEKLKSLLELMGFESMAIFGDCFDEVTLLDPVSFGLKTFYEVLAGALSRCDEAVCKRGLSKRLVEFWKVASFLSRFPFGIGSQH